MGAIFILAFWLAACDKDNDDKERHDLIEGMWNISNVEIDATPIANATLTEVELEAIYSNYTFFTVGSPVTFKNDSINFIASFGGAQFPMQLPYLLKDDLLTIKAELAPSVVLEIKGDVDMHTNSFEYNLTEQSYMSILQFISSTGIDANLTRALTQTARADAEYTLTRSN